MSVTLVGPALLFSGLAQQLFDFEEVTAVRLFSPYSAKESRSFPYRGHEVTLYHLTALPPARARHRSVQTLTLLWHECLPRGRDAETASLLPHCPCPAVLFGRYREGTHATTEKNSLSSSPSVQLSLFDTPGTLAAGLRAAAAGQPFTSPLLGLLREAKSAHPSDNRILAPGSTLSKKEQEVALLAGDGLSNQEIAAALYVSLSTVKTHLNRSFAKLGIQRRAQLHAVLAPIRSPHPTAIPPPFESAGETGETPLQYHEVLWQAKDGHTLIPLFADESLQTDGGEEER